MSKRKLSRIFVWLVLGLALVGLSACGNSTPTPSQSAPPLEAVIPSPVPPAIETIEIPTTVIASTATTIPTMLPTIPSTKMPVPSPTPVRVEPLTTESDAIVFESAGSLYVQPVDTLGKPIDSPITLIERDLAIGGTGLVYDVVPSPNGKYLYLWVIKSVDCNECTPPAFQMIYNIRTGSLEEIQMSLSRFQGWHPNGVELVYAGDEGAIGLYNVESKQSRIIAQVQDWLGSPWGPLVRGAAFSPDGAQMIASFEFEYRGIAPQAWLADADGANPHKVIDGYASQFVWSPDSKLILFDGLDSIQSNGQNRRILSRRASTTWGFSLHWSPDGRYIAFNGQEELPIYPNLGDGRQLVYEYHKIHILDLETGNERRLIEDELGGDIQPAWSPDGKRIAFLSNRSGYSELWVADADGNNLEQLTFDKQPKRAQVTWIDVVQ